jgi:putative transposase
MMVTQAFRYQLDPTGRQRRLLGMSAGTARYAYNWGLVFCKRRLDAHQPVPSAAAWHRLWNAEKPQRSWVYGVSKCGGQESLRNLERAFTNFWRGRQAGRLVGFPRLRKKHGRRDSFRLTGAIKVHLQSASLPRIGGVRTKETTEKFHGRILSATVSREADRWYVSLAVEVERADPQPLEGPVVGIDLGLKCFAVPSDGTEIEAPRPLAKALRRLRHRQRLHSRKRRGSRNRRKSASGLGRLHRRIRCQRADFLHKTTTALAITKSVIVVEDLSVHGMIRHRPLSRSIADAGWAEFRWMLEYKTQWYGSRIIVAPRFFPSTKTCSACGHVKDAMPRAERVFRCEACGHVLGRDLNAARNLAAVAGSSPETQNACGAEGSGQENGPVKPAAVKHLQARNWSRRRSGTKGHEERNGSASSYEGRKREAAGLEGRRGAQHGLNGAIGGGMRMGAQ